jgi:hypothetical protein
MTKDGIARAAQALAPRVAKSVLKQTEYIHSTFNAYSPPLEDSTLISFFLD